MYVLLGFVYSSVILFLPHSCASSHRDGQDTVSRNFNFTRQVEIDVIGGNNVNYLLKLMVTTEEQTKIVITKTDGDPLEKKDIMQQLISDIFDREHPILSEDNKTLILVL